MAWYTARKKQSCEKNGQDANQHRKTYEQNNHNKFFFYEFAKVALNHCKPLEFCVKIINNNNNNKNNQKKNHTTQIPLLNLYQKKKSYSSNSIIELVVY